MLLLFPMSCQFVFYVFGAFIFSARSLDSEWIIFLINEINPLPRDRKSLVVPFPFVYKASSCNVNTRSAIVFCLDFSSSYPPHFPALRRPGPCVYYTVVSPLSYTLSPLAFFNFEA